MLSEEVTKLKTDWKNIILYNKYDIQTISDELQQERFIYEPSVHIFPPNSRIFNAFDYFNINELKVVFVGQDCYHGKNQANGLCFSVPDGIVPPPSLRNILKELSEDLDCTRTNTDFTDLAQQGILFINSALSVREKCPESHMPLWSNFTDNILKQISDKTDKVIFVLWGNFAKKKKKFIDCNKHCILEAVHPSPLGANRGGFFGCKHFSKINKKLEEWGKDKIIWT